MICCTQIVCYLYGVILWSDLLLFQKDKKVPAIILADTVKPLSWICDRKLRNKFGISSTYVFASNSGEEYTFSAHLTLIIHYMVNLKCQAAMLSTFIHKLILSVIICY